MDARYKELSDRAFKLHKNGDYKEAEKIYTLLLQINPSDVNVLNLYGLLCISVKNFNDAIKLLSKAVIIRPSSYISGNLAKAYYEAGEYNNAVILLESIVKEAPSDDLYYSLGLSYKKINKLQNAIDSYISALNINPLHYSALYNLANLYKDSNMYYEAEKIAERALKINPNDIGLHSLLSEIYAYKNDYAKAIDELKFCINSDEKNYLYFYNIAVYYSKLNNKSESEKYYLKAIKLNPLHVSSMVNLASLYKENNKKKSLEILENAYKYFPNEEILCLSLAQVYRDLYLNKKSKFILKKLLKINPKCAEAFIIIGTNCMDEGKYKTALNYFDKAIKLCPNNLNYLHNKATALKYLKKFEDSEKILKKIVKHPDASIQSKLSLAMLYLQKKEFTKGMKLYGLRYLEDNLPEKFKEKIWNKSIKLKNKNILLYSNCGLGDTIMYSRYIPYLNKICKSISIQTDKELVNLLKYNYPKINVYKKSEKVDNFDILLQVMDSAYALNMDFNNIPYFDGYLQADENKVKEYQNLNIFQTKKLKVGIFYQGNKKIFRNRPIPYKDISKLADLDNIQLYSFQIDNNLEEEDYIINLSNYIKDYSDTAALLKCIDVLITIDSSIVHMAGALSVKTKLLIPKVSEWRWFDDTKTTPWYNSVEIIRQKKAFDWSKEIEKIKSELNEYKR